MPRALLLTLLALLGACGASNPPAPVQTLTTQCSQPRPQVCTMEYDPVCGELSGGGREDYSSPCNACAHDAVAAYRPGGCESGGAGE